MNKMCTNTTNHLYFADILFYFIHFNVLLRFTFIELTLRQLQIWRTQYGGGRTHPLLWDLLIPFKI